MSFVMGIQKEKKKILFEVGTDLTSYKFMRFI